MFGVSGLRATQIMGTGGVWSPRACARYAAWSGWFLSGHLAGGLLIGGLLGALGAWLRPGPTGAGALVLVCLVGAGRELGLHRLPLPCWERQVDRRWMWRLPWDLVAFVYGLQLGSAVATRIKMATTHAALGCALLSGSTARGALIMGTFGLVRAVPPALIGPRVTSPVHSLGFSRAVDGHEAWMRRANGLALLAAALFLAGVWWQGGWA